MRIAILGAQGQLGHAFSQRLGEQALALGRAQADLTKPDTVAAALKSYRPTVVLNCAAYNQVDQAELDSEAAFAVNALGVRRLAQVCAELDCVLVHYSTNYVFGLDRARHHPYLEEDEAVPVSAYGASKVTGEGFVRSLCPRHFVLRTTGLFGPRGANSRGSCFVDNVLRWAGEGKSLRIVNDQICTPTYTRDLVDATLRLVQNGAYGLYHVTASGACSWHEFACAVLRKAGYVNAKKQKPEEIGLLSVPKVGLEPTLP